MLKQWKKLKNENSQNCFCCLCCMIFNGRLRFEFQIIDFVTIWTLKFFRSCHDQASVLLSLALRCLLWPLNYAWIARQFVDKRRFFKRGFHCDAVGAAQKWYIKSSHEQMNESANVVFPLITRECYQLPTTSARHLLIRDRRYNLIGSNNIASLQMFEIIKLMDFVLCCCQGTVFFA